jgi:hypothetical protein
MATVTLGQAIGQGCKCLHNNDLRRRLTSRRLAMTSLRDKIVLGFHKDLLFPLFPGIIEPLVQEYDSVSVSGYCISEGRFYYHLRGIIVSISRQEFKLWPHDYIGDGKLWFRRPTARITAFHSTLFD